MRWLGALLLAMSSALLAEPRSHYMIHCMGCHLNDGSGQPPDVPVLDATLNRYAATDAGRAYLVQVPGAAQAPLDDNDLAVLINWMITTFGGRNEHFAPITPAEVASYRAKPLKDPAATRAELLAD